MDSSVDAIIGYDLDGILTGWNAGAQRMFGYTGAEMLGAFVTHLVPPDQQHATEALRRQAAAGARLGQVAAVRIRRDGVPIQVRVTFIPITDHGGGVIAFTELITAVRVSPAEPAGTLAPLGGSVPVLAGVAGPVAIAGPVGVSGAIETGMIGAAGSAAPPAIFGPAGPAGPAGLGGSPGLGGSAGGGRMSGFDRRGRHDHYLEAEIYQRVRDDPAIFDFLQDGSLDGIWYWDLDNPDQEWMSPRLKQVFGYTDDEVPNPSTWWQTNIFPDDRDRAMDNFHKHAADPHHPYDQIVRYHHKNGSTVWVRCRGLIIRDSTGRPQRMLGAHTDVTSLKQAEQALASHAVDLERVNQELADLNQLKADLLTTLSHEINQPLCVIRNYSGLLASRWDLLADEQRLSWVQALDEGARELARLVADLLLMFRMDAAAITASRCPVDLRTVIDQAIAGLTGRSQVDVELDGDMSVLMDRGHLRQILVNLLTNAVKYGQPPYRITAVRASGRARIAIADAGKGVSSAFVPRLFDRFTRADGASGLGAGLGLFIVDQLAQANGAAVTYQPVRPHGACFVVDADLVPADAHADSLAAKPRIPAAASR